MREIDKVFDKDGNDLNLSTYVDETRTTILEMEVMNHDGQCILLTRESASILAERLKHFADKGYL